MPTFVVCGHDAPTTDDFPLDDLTGAGGRLDLLARCVLDALLTSHGIREDTAVHLVLQDEVTVRFDGAALRNLHPDERSTAALVRTALAERNEAIGHRPVEVSPGLSVAILGLADTLDALADGGPCLRLAPSGTPAAEAALPTDPTFVLSDHRPFTDPERSLLAKYTDAVVGLGPVALHANQAITVTHNWLDTDGFDRYE